MQGAETPSASHHKSLIMLQLVGIELAVTVMYRYIHVERCLPLRRKECTQTSTSMSTRRCDFIGFCDLAPNAATAVRISGWLTNSNSPGTAVHI